MITITITVENREQVEAILALLTEGEEDGELNFSFGVKTYDNHISYTSE